jgi:positive regulator of sigma E activity
MVVEFVKELPFINLLPTKYLAWIIALFLLIVSNLVTNSFFMQDLSLYVLTAISISLASNGLHDFNRKVLDEKENKI